jgi:hypothetical protein
VGGVLGGVLSSGAPTPQLLTAEEREALMEAYLEKLIDDRFERVRYPHLASAASTSTLLPQCPAPTVPASSGCVATLHARRSRRSASNNCPTVACAYS